MVYTSLCTTLLLAILAAGPVGTEKKTPRPGPAPELLTPHVEATRCGRVLKLDYRLEGPGQERATVDARDRSSPPKFTVCQDGREIGSGTFEYG